MNIFYTKLIDFIARHSRENGNPVTVILQKKTLDSYFRGNDETANQQCINVARSRSCSV